MTVCSSNADEVITSLELHFLIDRHLAARRAGHHDMASVYGHAAQGLLAATMPAHADAIASVASRKGEGRSIGSALAQTMSPALAAAVCTVWLIRGARRPAIDALASAFGNDPAFLATVKMLCRRVFETVPMTTSPTPSPPTSSTASFEAFAPPGR